MIKQTQAPSIVSLKIKPGTPIPTVDNNDLKCPLCNCDAVYRYGKAWTGKQRFLCKMCGRQFTESHRRVSVKERPLCPECGSHMNLYKTQGDMVRFRCSRYPECRTFKKYRIAAEDHEVPY